MKAFNLPQNYTTFFCTGICVVGATIATVAIVVQNVQKTASDQAFQQASSQRHSDRARALELVAKESRIRNCWITDGILTVDQVAPTAKNGALLPSSCVVSRDRSQYAFLSSYNGAMRMRFVFTQTEVINQLSRLK